MFFLGLVSLCSQAHALVEPLVHWEDTLVQGGVVTYDGSTALTGTGIVVDGLLGTDTPLQSGVPLACVGCNIDFTTGPLLSMSPGLWAFQAGGNFTLSGEVKSGSTVIASGTLMSGLFNNVTYSIDFGLEAVVAGSTAQTLDQDLASHFGLSTTGTAILTQQLSPFVFDQDTGGFEGAVVETDLVYKAEAAPPASVVPLPASVWLLIVGLAAYLGLGERRGIIKLAA